MACLASPSFFSASTSLQGSPLLRQQDVPLQSENSFCDENGPKYFKVLAQKKVQKKYQIVLSQDLPMLGKTGQLVTVKAGYYRNYLYPTGKAKIATEEYLKAIKLEEERREAEKKRIREAAEADAQLFRSIGVFNCRRKAGKGKQIFGQVTTQDLADIIKAQTSKEIDKRDIILPEIREIGEHIAQIKLHPEVIATVRVNVIPN